MKTEEEKEKLREFLHRELDSIYCYNCGSMENRRYCDDCHRKYMGWTPSDGLIEAIVNWPEGRK